MSQRSCTHSGLRVVGRRLCLPASRTILVIKIEPLDFAWRLFAHVNVYDFPPSLRSSDRSPCARQSRDAAATVGHSNSSPSRIEMLSRFDRLDCFARPRRDDQAVTSCGLRIGH